MQALGLKTCKGAGEQGSRGARGQRSRGARVKKSRGQQNRGAEEQGSRGALEVVKPEPEHPCTPAPRHPSMFSPVRVLVVEDSETDVLLLLREFKRGGCEVISERVDNVETMKAALDRQDWDIVISDYYMPQFTGLEALSLLKEKGLDLPFIVVSGAIGEETAVEAMKAGAHDYIMKDKLARLVPAVEREVREAKVRREQRRAGVALRKWADAFKFSPWGIAIIGADGAFEMMNPAFAEMHGYSVEELTDRPVVEVFPPQTGEIFSRLARVADEKGSAAAEVEKFRKDGTRFPALVELQAVRDERGHVLYRVISVRNIAKRRRAESEREVIHEIIQGATLTTNLDEFLHLVNQAIKKVHYAENCFVALYDSKTETFSFPYFVDEFDSVPPSRKMKNTPTDYVFRTGQPILSTSDSFRQLLEREEIDLPGTNPRVWLGVPLKTPHEAIGVLALQHYTDEHAYTERDLEFLLSVGGQIALAIEHKRFEEALRASEDRYRDLVEHSHDLICTHDLEGRVLSVNRAAANILGYDPNDYARWNVRDILAPEYRQRFSEYLALIKRDGVARGVMQVMTASGEKRIWEYTNTLRTEGVEVPIVRGMAHDITERKRAERALRISEKKYKDIFEFAPLGIYQSLRDGTIRTANRALAEMLGYGTVDELLRVNLAKDVYADAEERERLILQYEPAGYASNVELQWKKKDGTPIWISLNTHAIRDAEGRAQYFEGFVRDITERRRAESERERLYEQVQAGRKQLEALSGRLLDVQETERLALARELHDEIGQVLTGLKLTLEMAARLPARDARTRLGEAMALVNRLMAQVRDLSLDLRPAMLDDLGLLPALMWHFDRYTAQTSVEVIFSHDLVEGQRFAPEVETAAYRIVQESLTNVARHAGVSHVRARARVARHALIIEIEDRGAGFDYEAQLSAGGTGGLAGMRERARLLGGRLTVESRTGRGSRLTAELPVGGQRSAVSGQ